MLFVKHILWLPLESLVINNDCPVCSIPYKVNRAIDDMPVNKLLVSMAVPMILSMLMQAMYNIVDSIFVGRFDQNALSAVTMAFPAQSLMIAIAAGTGVGVNSLLSYSLGRKDRESANKAATHGIFLAFCAAILFLVLGLFLSEPFYRWQISAKEWSENPEASI